MQYFDGIAMSFLNIFYSFIALRGFIDTGSSKLYIFCFNPLCNEHPVPDADRNKAASKID